MNLKLKCQTGAAPIPNTIVSTWAPFSASPGGETEYRDEREEREDRVVGREGRVKVVVPLSTAFTAWMSFALPWVMVRRLSCESRTPLAFSEVMSLEGLRARARQVLVSFWRARARVEPAQPPVAPRKTMVGILMVWFLRWL